MDDKLTPAEAGAIAGRARKLLHRGLLTHHQFVLLDTLLWSCRRSGAATAKVSYGQLQQAAHLARATVAGGLVVLERLGLIQKTKARLLAIGANGGRIWKQLTTTYRLLKADLRESARQTDSKPLDSIHIVETVASQTIKAAQEALRVVTERREAERAMAWLRRSANRT